MKKLKVIILGLAFTASVATAISTNASVSAFFKTTSGNVLPVTSLQVYCSGTAILCTAIVNGQVVSPIYATQQGAQNQMPSLVLKDGI
jgi:hypothetical protein